MNFLIFRNSSRFFLKFSEFLMKFLRFSELKIKFSNSKSIFRIFISEQVTWHNLEHPISCDRRSRAGDDVAQRGASDHPIKS